ncbi:unnamed protein product [Absidia cylindrospora]
MGVLNMNYLPMGKRKHAETEDKASSKFTDIVLANLPDQTEAPVLGKNPFFELSQSQSGW